MSCEFPVHDVVLIVNYARNEKIVAESDMVVAFTEKDCGGTWNTIKTAQKRNVPVKIIRPSALFPGDDPEPPDGADPSTAEQGDALDEDTVTPTKGAGPFQIRRAGLGSYALRRKCYIPPEEWSRIIVAKDSKPTELADRISKDMTAFFDAHKRLGVVHALAMPPRSLRHLDRPHPVELAGQAVAAHLGCPFVALFSPWEKSTRGRFAKPGEIALADGAARSLIGKVVWVLDDVFTTGRTLRAAVQALLALEIHAHGLAWVYMA